MKIERRGASLLVTAAAAVMVMASLVCFNGIVVSNFSTKIHDDDEAAANMKNKTITSSSTILGSFHRRRVLSNIDDNNSETYTDNTIGPDVAAAVTDALPNVAIIVNDVHHPYGDCEVPKARFATHKVATMYQPAFPGSGSRMTYELVQALTGLTSSNDHNYALDPNVHHRVVTVKTHYPNRNGISLEGFDSDFHGAILVVRNPVKAIPSFFNFWYERLNHLENHSVRAPKEDWILFRDANLMEQLKSWMKHMDYWLQKYQHDRSKLLVLPYEYITDNEKGPATALRLAEFLDAAEGVDVAPPDKVACIWHHSVKYYDEGTDVAGHSVREGSKATPYTQDQFNEIQRALQRQKWKYQHDSEVFSIMNLYLRQRWTDNDVAI